MWDVGYRPLKPTCIRRFMLLFWIVWNQLLFSLSSSLAQGQELPQNDARYSEPQECVSRPSSTQQCRCRGGSHEDSTVLHIHAARRLGLLKQCGTVALWISLFLHEFCLVRLIGVLQEGYVTLLNPWPCQLCLVTFHWTIVSHGVWWRLNSQRMSLPLWKCKCQQPPWVRNRWMFGHRPLWGWLKTSGIKSTELDILCSRIWKLTAKLSWKNWPGRFPRTSPIWAGLWTITIPCLMNLGKGNLIQSWSLLMRVPVRVKGSHVYSLGVEPCPPGPILFRWFSITMERDDLGTSG